ncbi:MAG: hypothetical protein K8823_99 [Cenarchaeum symbiont of Oopsacas minuta]|nr:hypothetical protein [Cenarchaeum symbiont of Oopsacas minuta]
MVKNSTAVVSLPHMRLTVALVIATLIIASTMMIFGAPDQVAEAKTIRKIHFTETVQSSSDPGIGNNGKEMAILLSPNPGTIYVGTLTYTASSPVKVMVLHELKDGDADDQPIWTVDGDTKYAITLLEPSKSNSIDFVGAALALHSDNSSFKATASIDGWIRGEPIDMIVNTVLVSTADRQPDLKLARTVLPITLPMHLGFYDGGDVHYVITDASKQNIAKDITKWQNYNVSLAVSLEDVPELALGKVYLFKNGIKGTGVYGYQSEIFSNTPEQPLYGSLRLMITAEWNKGQKESIIESENDLLEQVGKGRVVLDKSGPILNMPQIKWPGGAMPQIANLTITDYEKLPYGTGSQILSIDEANMTVTFVSHREWAEDGRTLYCIPVATTPLEIANTMGIVGAPASSILANSDAATDYYEFRNGINGSGPLGFQPSIRYGIPGENDYSPIQKISIIDWVNPGEAQVLANKDDIKAAYATESITITQARPLNSNHVINCPIVYPMIQEASEQADNKTGTDENQ